MPKGIKLPSIILNCANCGKTFSRINSDHDRIYCSYRCMREGRRPKLRLCDQCGQKFRPRRPKTRFCSGICRNTWRSWFRHGLAKGEDVRSRKLQLIRSRNECSRCGWNIVPAILELHHKDRNRKNVDINNLELLCPNCHSIDHYQAKDGQFANNLGVVACL